MRPDLHGLLAELIERQPVRLERDDPRRTEWRTLPSLWEQLESSVMQSGGTGGGRSSAGRLPISTTVVDLIVDITSAATEGAIEHVGASRHNTPANLLAVASKLIALPDGDDVRAWWTWRIAEWTSDARAALRLDPDRPRWARGVACPDCGATHAVGSDGVEATRIPALTIMWAEPADGVWWVRAVACAACGAAWWRGVSLDGLALRMLTAATRQA